MANLGDACPSGLWPRAAVLTLACLACFAAPEAARALDLVRITGLSPLPPGTACNGGPQAATLYRNSEAEPFLAVDPTDPMTLVAVWQQDRWSQAGGAQGSGTAVSHDGGATWTPVFVPFTRCSGAGPGDPGDWQRTTDPWVSFGPLGTAYQMVLGFDFTGRVGGGMLVSRSLDDGLTWSEPQILRQENGLGFGVAFLDKNTITADPVNPGHVYAIWTGFTNNHAPTQFSRSLDGGASWEPARRVYRTVDDLPGAEVSKVGIGSNGAQIVVLPDGMLVTVFNRSYPGPRDEIALIRSFNRGKQWERQASVVMPIEVTSAVDFEEGIPVRDAGPLPDIAVDDASGDLYVVAQTAGPAGLATVEITRSTDGGLTWSAPVPVSPLAADGVQTFLPAVHVAQDGTVGVLFYDFRNDQAGDARLDTDVFLRAFTPDLTPLAETRLTDASFDLRQAGISRTSGAIRGYFLGDYMGLAADQTDFLAAFAITNELGLPATIPPADTLVIDDNDRQDIVFARVPIAP